jgi:hypothetical protein
MIKSKITLTHNDRRYLDKLQAEADTFKVRLDEFQRITLGKTDDAFLLSLFAEARGKILNELTQRKRLWASYHPDRDAVDLLDTATHKEI